MIVLVALLVIAIPIVAIAGFVIAINARNRLHGLEYRLAGLERSLSERLTAIATAVPPQSAPEPSAQMPSEPESVSLHQPEAEPARITATSVPPVSPSAPVAVLTPMGLEERLGTQWAVWVGGVALALGGFFLVRYSIEQGWFGPSTRVLLGALLAIGLIAAGECARRKENLTGFAGLSSAHIPSILTAAGTAVAYADAYAAYALYNLIGSAAAFVLLGVIAFATFAAALLHGAALAGLGLVGAYVTPLIVSTAQPNFWALYLYLAVATAAAFALARVRMWRWLAISAVVFGFLWTLPGLDALPRIGLAPHLFHTAVGFALVAALIVSGLLFGPDSEQGRIDPVSSAAVAVYLLGATLIVLASRHDPLALTGFTVLVAATVAIAWRADSAAAAVPAAGIMVALVFLQFAVHIHFEQLILAGGPASGVVPEAQRVFYGTHLALGAAFAVLFGCTGFLAQGRSTQPTVPILWAASAVFVPIAILIALYYRIYAFEQSIPFTGLALLLAALFAAATERLYRREPQPGLASAGAIFAAGAAAALALALAMTLEKGWLTVALALMAPGVAWVALRRPLPVLRWLAAAIIILVLARVAWEPRIVGHDIGTTPIFNWLLWGYGVPAAAFWLAGHLLRRRADDVPARMAEAAGLLFTVLLAFLEIRHYMTGGNIYFTSSTLAEIALQVCVGLALTIGLEWLRLRTNSIVHDLGALIIAALTLIAIVIGLGLVANPMIQPHNIGGPFINLILLGYGLPAALSSALALLTRKQRPLLYSRIAAVVAVGLAIFYFSLEVRTLYHGPILTAGPVTSAEQYTYSVIWLALGVILLTIGTILRSQAVRLASAAVVVLTVLKVFLVDMHDLTGIWQAASFIGLGVVLMGIGWSYQRLLFPRRIAAQT